DPVARERQRHLQRRAPLRAPERERRLLEVAIDRLDRRARRPYQQRQRHHRGRDHGRIPGEDDGPAGRRVERSLEPAAAAEQHDQVVAGDRRRQHQRQRDEEIDQRPAPKPPPGQHVRERDADGGVQGGGEHGHADRQAEGGERLGRHRALDGGSKPERAAAATRAGSVRLTAVGYRGRPAPRAGQRPRCWMAVSAQFTPNTSARSSSDSATATSKLPLLVSSAMAVVSVRVWPLILPPTIMEAPISEITPPKPAITATSMGSRASRRTTATICVREAPRASICNRNFSGTFWTAASVMPITIGVAMTAWASTMAPGVYRSSHAPRGPLRHSRRDTNRPTTTGGRPMPAFTRDTAAGRPGKRTSASIAPDGTPSASDTSVASVDTSSDSQSTAYTSASPLTSRRSASTTPPTTRSMLAAARRQRLAGQRQLDDALIHAPRAHVGLAGQDMQHPTVVTEDEGAVPLHAVERGGAQELAHQQRAEPLALPAVLHHDRELDHALLAGDRLVSGDTYEGPGLRRRVLGHDGEAALVVDVREEMGPVGRQPLHDREESLIDGAAT